MPLSSCIEISVDGNGNPKESLNLSTPMGSIDAAMSHLGSSFEGKEAKSFADMTAEWSPLKDAERDGKVAFLLGSMFRIWG